MWQTMQIKFFLIVPSIYVVQSCVRTVPQCTAARGSNVNLTCNFSQCGSLGPMDTVEWEFQSQGSNSSDHIIDHRIKPSWPSVHFTGNVSLGDFSILLLAIEPDRSGTYKCRLRLNGHIHKNFTNVTIRMDRRFGSIVPASSPDDPSVTESSWQLGICGVIILLFLVGGALVGMWARHRKTTNQQPVAQSSQNTDPGLMLTPVQDNLNAADLKDTNIYVTLQRIRPAAQPPKKEDDIYVTMRFNQDGLQLPVQFPRKRSDLPTDWMTEETAASSVEETTEETAASTVEETTEETAASTVEEMTEETAASPVEDMTEETAASYIEEMAASPPASPLPQTDEVIYERMH